jgi:hypothetical protein
MKSVLSFVSEFIAKVNFIPKHFNCNFHFLNMTSVRWRPLLSTSPASVSGSSASLVAAWLEKLLPLFPDVLFHSSVVLGFFPYTFLLRYPQREKSQALRSGDLAGHLTFWYRNLAFTF